MEGRQTPTDKKAHMAFSRPHSNYEKKQKKFLNSRGLYRVFNKVKYQSSWKALNRSK